MPKSAHVGSPPKPNFDPIFSASQAVAARHGAPAHAQGPFSRPRSTALPARPPAVMSVAGPRPSPGCGYPVGAGNNAKIRNLAVSMRLEEG